MTPTKSKDLIKKTADQLNLPEELVKKVVDYYYAIVVKKIESLETTTIFLHGLGTLRLSRKKLKNQIGSLEKLLDSNSQEDFKKVIKFNLSKGMLESKLQALEMCNKYYEEIYERHNKNLEK